MPQKRWWRPCLIYCLITVDLCTYPKIWFTSMVNDMMTHCNGNYRWNYWRERQNVEIPYCLQVCISSSGGSSFGQWRWLWIFFEEVCCRSALESPDFAQVVRTINCTWPKRIPWLPILDYTQLGPNIDCPNQKGYNFGFHFTLLVGNWLSIEDSTYRPMKA